MANWEWDVIIVAVFAAAVVCVHIGVTIREWVSRRTHEDSNAA